MHITISQFEDLIYEELNKTLTLTELKAKFTPIAKHFQSLGDSPPGEELQKKWVVKFFSQEEHSPPQDELEDIIEEFVNYYSGGSWYDFGEEDVPLGLSREKFYDFLQQEMIAQTTGNKKNYRKVQAAWSENNFFARVTLKENIKNIQSALIKQAQDTKDRDISECIIVNHDLLTVAYNNLLKWHKKHEKLLKQLLCVKENTKGCLSIMDPFKTVPDKKEKILIQRTLVNYAKELPIILNKIHHYSSLINVYIKQSGHKAAEAIKSQETSPQTKQASVDYLQVLGDIAGYVIPYYDAVNDPNLSGPERVFWAAFDTVLIAMGVVMAEGVGLVAAFLGAMSMWFSGMFVMWVGFHIGLWALQKVIRAINYVIKTWNDLGSQGVDAKLVIPSRCMPGVDSDDPGGTPDDPPPPESDQGGGEVPGETEAEKDEKDKGTGGR